MRPESTAYDFCLRSIVSRAYDPDIEAAATERPPMSSILTIITVGSGLTLAGIFAFADGIRLARLAHRGEI